MTEHRISWGITERKQADRRWWHKAAGFIPTVVTVKEVSIVVECEDGDASDKALRDLLGSLKELAIKNEQNTVKNEMEVGRQYVRKSHT